MGETEMEQVSTWFEGLSTTATQMLATLISYLPNLLGAVLLLLAGWVIARLLRVGIQRAGDGINRLLDRFLRAGSLLKVRLSPQALQLVGNIAFWLIILFFITAATKVARLDAFSAWLDQIVAYLPTLLASGLIILAGYLISALVRDLVSATILSSGLGQSELFGALAQGVTLLLAVMIGIEQIGIDITFLVTFIAIVVGAVLAALSIAFGLGARNYVSNLIGAHALQQQFQPGQFARMGAVEGEILEFTPTGVILATAEGRLTVPAKIFDEEVTLLVTPEDDHD